jgi:pimeloyl-ACP methyl ester carboxylesterase
VGESIRTLDLSDGRTLAFAVWGDTGGFPILSLHGTPGCRLGRWPREELYVELGVCFVTHDRAGYGRSDRHHGRRVVDVVADVRAVADGLGFDRFGLSGGSGGGPHALACAALLPDRVVRAICDVGVAPLGTPGLGCRSGIRAARANLRSRAGDRAGRARDGVGCEGRSCQAAYSYSWIRPPRRSRRSS